MNKQELRTNKQELISKYELLKNSYNFNVVAIDDIISDLKRLDEPEKVEIPQFVADWIEVCKENLAIGLYTAMTPNFMKENGQSFDLILWIKKASNQETFARAWLDGYEVEKEKRYVATLKNGQPLVKSQSGNTLYFNQNITAGNYKASRKELEEAGFGWVFSCEGVEVNEVK